MTARREQPGATDPARACRYHRWDHWTHCGAPESGCTLESRKFGCPYRDATKCPYFKPKEDRRK